MRSFSVMAALSGILHDSAACVEGYKTGIFIPRLAKEHNDPLEAY
jgi:hypothetical protein